jgi:protein TonB
MAREMFGDVVDPSVSVGTKKWYTVPLSILAHVAAVIGLVVTPLVAMNGVPTPQSVIVFVPAPPAKLPAAPPPPAELPKRPPMPMTTLLVSANLIPLQAPHGIIAEPPPLRLAPESGVASALPSTVASLGAGSLSAAPPSPTQIVRPGGDIKEPRKIHDARPIYPQVALAAKVEGTVTIEATISTDGSVINMRVTRSQPLLDQAALDAVRQWRFTPTLLNGAPVEVIMNVTVNFTLH